MLMAGNRSTGIRERLLMPMTTSARQTTMMKYGFRMEKRGMNFFRRRRLFFLLALVIEQLHLLRAHRFARFQAAPVADDNLFVPGETGDDLGVGCGLHSQRHRSSFDLIGLVNELHRALVAFMIDGLQRYRHGVLFPFER